MKENNNINEKNDSIHEIHNDNKGVLFQRLCNLQQLIKAEKNLKELCKKYILQKHKNILSNFFLSYQK